MKFHIQDLVLGEFSPTPEGVPFGIAPSWDFLAIDMSTRVCFGPIISLRAIKPSTHAAPAAGTLVRNAETCMGSMQPPRGFDGTPNKPRKSV
jgi:hypothetical protein